MPPEKDYLAVLTRYLTIVRDLPEAEFAKAFRDRIQLLNTTELHDAYWRAFEPNPDAVLRAGWQVEEYCNEITTKLKSIPNESRISVIPANMAADHLVVVLRTMARSCAALGEDLAAATLPPVSRIIRNMEQASPFWFLLQAVEETLTPR
jgi:hypothetical protein